MNHEITDAECARLAQNGYEEAFGILFRRYHELLKKIILNKSRTCDVEEIAQIVFLQVWKNIQNYDPKKGSVKVWIMSFANKRVVDDFRSRECRLRAYDRLEKSLNHTPTYNKIAMPKMEVFDATAMWRDRSELIEKAMSAISSLQAQCIRLSLVGLTHVEISEQLNTPLGTIKARIRNGVLALKRIISDRGYLKSIREAEAS
jgi:RNA polymerase sigma-70 factor (ECF subfamily)